jgi:hypothetical protein
MKILQNNTVSLTRIGFECMRCKMKNEDPNWNGIIINCASILGFVGWPEKPEPIYCRREPIIETSLDLVVS